MADMSVDYWERVRTAGFAVPTDRSLADLTTELTTMLGDPDPTLREATALAALDAWIARGTYDGLLAGLGDGMAAGLQVGLGESGTDSVLRRSGSATALGWCIRRAGSARLLPREQTLGWGDRLATWLLGEQDCRAFPAGADALADLAGSPDLERPEVTVVLEVLAERAVAPAPPYGREVADRMAAAVVRILRRELTVSDDLEPWVERLAVAAENGSTGPQELLRSLFVLLTLDADPPSARSDLILLLVDALRRAHPDLLSPPEGGPSR